MSKKTIGNTAKELELLNELKELDTEELSEEEELKLLSDLEELDNKELSEEEVQDDIAKMESELSKHDSKNDFKIFKDNLKKDLATDPDSSVVKPVGSKSVPDGGCCTIS
ncbi:MAG: hypothetical protein V4694_03050 [Pseudomonadota bacterium]